MLERRVSSLLVARSQREITLRSVSNAGTSSFNFLQLLLTSVTRRCFNTGIVFLPASLPLGWWTVSFSNPLGCPTNESRIGLMNIGQAQMNLRCFYLKRE